MMLRTAEFSPCGQYRYSLSRTWRVDGPDVVFVGLNPSTADETADDPTLRRCIRFAKSWEYGSLVLVNLFAYRSVNPANLKKVIDPVGPRNDTFIRRYCERTSRIVVAWGAGGMRHGRDQDVLSLVKNPYCLGLTQNGAPKHPLYLRGKTRLRPFCEQRILTAGDSSQVTLRVANSVKCHWRVLRRLRCTLENRSLSGNLNPERTSSPSRACSLLMRRTAVSER
jgi:hypothetical protein